MILALTLPSPLMEITSNNLPWVGMDIFWNHTMAKKMF